ncbi:MAG: hypothetical protein OEM02_05515 [Desulfobulbaceae bacterium]|nr:hypothetical protein [Desulfobulbaceae bacterium]
MKLRFEKNIVEFCPENEEEKDSLETLWRQLIDCVKDTKKLVPIGEYVPEKNNVARFTVES